MRAALMNVGAVVLSVACIGGPFLLDMFGVLR